MYNIFAIALFFLTTPLQVYSISCWCQKGPSTYQTLVDNAYTSFYTNCYLTGNNPSSNTCFDATCPCGDWVMGNSYASGEVLVSATDGDDCISQCSALGGDYNIANMEASCGNSNGNNYDGSCNILTCPHIWDGQCGTFNKPTDKWCDYDGPESNANICCADDFSECCESDGGAIGGTIGAVVVFIVFCIWYCKRCFTRCCGEPNENNEQSNKNIPYTDVELR